MTGSSSTGIDPRLAAVLCYSLWWLTGLVFLVIERHDATVRFHAAQATVLFGGLSLLLAAIGVLSALSLLTAAPAYQALRLAGDLLWAAAAVAWLLLMLRTWGGETWRVPLVATLADRLAGQSGAA